MPADTWYVRLSEKTGSDRPIVKTAQMTDLIRGRGLTEEPHSSTIRQHLLEYRLDRVRRNPKFNKSRHLWR
jgi:hypothetical protein